MQFQVRERGTKFEGEMSTRETPMRRMTVRFALAALGTCVLACGAPGERGALVGDSIAVVAVDSPSTAPQAAPGSDSQTTAPTPAAASPSTPGGHGGLSPLADTIAQRLVFVPLVERWFTAAARTRKLYVDLGRVDMDLKKDPARLAAFSRAAAARSPFPIGTPFEVRGAWGSERGTLSGFEAYNGRIVGTLDGVPVGDSLARVTDPLVASVERTDASSAPPAAAGATACDRTATPEFAARLTRLGKAMEDSLRASTDQPIYPRLKASLKARRSQVTGCFGAARGVVVVTLYAGDYEWVRERILLVGDSATQKATVRDLRFRAHEALEALDADGDGIDDLAARAWTPRGGGTVILKLVDAPPRRFERLASGFAWER